MRNETAIILHGIDICVGIMVIYLDYLGYGLIWIGAAFCWYGAIGIANED